MDVQTEVVEDLLMKLPDRKEPSKVASNGRDLTEWRFFEFLASFSIN